MSFQSRLLNQVLHLNKGYWKDIASLEPEAIAQREEQLYRWIPQIPNAIFVDNLEVGEVPVQRLSVVQSEFSHPLLYFHGGGFIAGSPNTSHRDYLWRVAKFSDCRVWAVAYRKLPRHPFPAALDDAYQVYLHLLEEHAPQTISIAGDSAGGGLALSLVLRLKDEGLPLPAVVVVFSPWTDLTCSGDSMISNRHTEVMVPEHLLSELASQYAGVHALDHPYVSPLFGDFKGFPPSMIMASDSEVLIDDTLRIVERMQSSGVEVNLHQGKRLPHAWPVFARFLPEGRVALTRMAEFIRQHRVS